MTKIRCSFSLPSFFNEYSCFFCWIGVPLSVHHVLSWFSLYCHVTEMFAFGQKNLFGHEGVDIGVCCWIKLFCPFQLIVNWIFQTTAQRHFTFDQRNFFLMFCSRGSMVCCLTGLFNLATRFCNIDWCAPSIRCTCTPYMWSSSSLVFPLVMMKYLYEYFWNTVSPFSIFSCLPFFVVFLRLP